MGWAAQSLGSNSVAPGTKLELTLTKKSGRHWAQPSPSLLYGTWATETLECHVSLLPSGEILNRGAETEEENECR